MVALPFALAAVACLFFGLTIVPSHGGYSDPAVTWVIFGLLTASALFFAWHCLSTKTLPLVWVTRLAVVGVGALALSPALVKEPLLYAQSPWTVARVAQWVFFGVVLTYGLSLFREVGRPVRLARFALLGVLTAFIATEAVRSSPAPAIDVWTVQQSGAEALASGQNPFQVVALKDTGPREAEDVPYVYPPLHLLVSTPFWVLFQDVRYGLALALLALGFAVRALAVRTSGGSLPSVLEDLPALLLWSMTMLPFLVEQGWIDPVPMALFSAFVLARERRWLAPVLAGLVIGAKQTMAVVVLPIGLALGFSISQWAVVGVSVLAPIAPWAAWDFKAWKHANFDFLSALPQREDALTVITWMKRRLHLTVSPRAGFITAAGVLGYAFFYRRRVAIEVAVVTSLTAMTFFFAFNKWAFANYYFTLAGLAAVAAAVHLKSSEVGTSATGHPVLPSGVEASEGSGRPADLHFLAR